MAKDEGLPAVGTATHLYASGGVYVVTVADENNAARNKKFTIVVPFGPVMTVAEDPTDTTRRSVLVTVDNAGQDAVVLDWGDNTPTSTNPGDGVAQTRHRYNQAGIYTVTATDVDDPTRKTTAEVRVPFTAVAPQIVLTEVPADPRREVRMTINNAVAGRTYEVRWEAGGAFEDVPAGSTPPHSITHPYGADNTFVVTVRDKADTTKTVDENVTVPFGGPPFTVAQNGTEARGVSATIDTPTTGVTYEANWGDSATWADMTGAPPALIHTYGGTGQQTFKVSVRDKAIPGVVTTRQVTVPFAAPFAEATVSEAESKSAARKRSK